MSSSPLIYGKDGAVLSADTVQKDNPGFAYGVVDGPATGTEKFGQAHPIDYQLLYLLYKTHPDVFAAVQKWVGGVTTPGWHLESINQEGTSLHAKDSAAAERLRRDLIDANPFQKFTELLKETVMHLAIAGDAYWYKAKARDGAIELWGLHPATMRVKATKHGDVVGYVQQVGNQGELVDFAVQDIIHFRLPTPVSDIYGESPLQVALEEVITDLYAVQSNQNFFINDMTPRSWMILDDKLDAKQLDRARALMKEQHGSAKNAHKMLLAQGVKDIKVLQATMKELEFLEGRALATKKICAAYEVPDVLLGYHNTGDYATSGILEKQFYVNKIRPLQLQLAEQITGELIALLNPNLEFAFNAADLTDQDQKIANYLLAQQQGILTANEVREQIFGLPPLEEVAPDEIGEGDEDELDEEDAEEQAEGQTEPEKPGQSPRNPRTPATKSIHDAYHAALDNLAHERLLTLNHLASQLQPKVSGYFLVQEQRILNRLSLTAKTYKSTDPSRQADTVLDDDNQRHKDNRALLALAEAVLLEAAREGFLAAKTQARFTSDYTIVADPVERYLQTQAAQHITGINDTTAQALRDTLVEGYKNGESVDQLSARVRDVFDAATTSRAKLIARTETAQAFEFANRQALEKSGVVAQRVWLTAEDERVESQCQALDGVATDKNDQFPGGVEPGFVHPGCRCTSIGIIG